MWDAFSHQNDFEVTVRCRSFLVRHIHFLSNMPRRPPTAASASSLSRTQTTPYPLNRPLSRSTQGTGRPRTARPRTATSTTGNDTNVIGAVTEGTNIPPNRCWHFRSRHCYFSWNVFLITWYWRMHSQSSFIPSIPRLTQISDSQTYGKTIHKIAVFDPIEVDKYLEYSLMQDCDAWIEC